MQDHIPLPNRNRRRDDGRRMNRITETMFCFFDNFFPERVIADSNNGKGVGFKRGIIRSSLRNTKQCSGVLRVEKTLHICSLCEQTIKHYASMFAATLYYRFIYFHEIFPLSLTWHC